MDTGLNLGGQHFNNLWGGGYSRSHEVQNGDEEDHRSLRSPTDDHVGPGPVPLAAPSHHSASPIVAGSSFRNELLGLSGRQGVGRAQGSLQISNRGAWLQA